MGASGAVIMSFFGALFAALTMYWQWHVAGAALALPFAVFVAIGFAAVRVIKLPGDGVVVSPRVERAIMWSTIGEGIGLFVASNIVINLHRPDLLLPAMALIVGLHFLPIAFAASFRPFYALGVALILASALGFAVAVPVGGEIAGLAAAASLWGAAIAAVRRERRAKRQVVPIG